MNRTFGFEIEFSEERVRRDVISTACRTATRNSIYPYSTHEGTNNWTFKSEHCGYEFTSPALPIHPSSFKMIRDVFSKINEKCNRRSLVDSECGFHVHILANDLERKHFRNLLKWFWKLEPAIQSIIPASRRENDYIANLRNEFRYPELRSIAVPGKDYDPDEDEDGDCDWEYRYDASFGFDPWRHADSYKTLEIRYAASTSQPDKIINWIQLMIYLFEIGLNKQPTRVVNPDHKTICNVLQTNDIRYKFIQNRVKQLQKWIAERHEQLKEDG